MAPPERPGHLGKDHHANQFKYYPGKCVGTNERSTFHLDTPQQLQEGLEREEHRRC